MTVARTIVKHAVERTLVGSGLAALHRRRMRDRVLVLAYHNIVDDHAAATGDLANHLPLSTFRAQLDFLRSTADVVPLAEALEDDGVARRRPRAVITFDDAYRGAVLRAVPELVKRGMPATIFVAPARLGDQRFWWDSLATPGAGLDAVLRDHALGPLAGRQELVLRWASGAGHVHGLLSPELHSCTMDELGQAASAPGITLGSHSWSHANLARLDDAALAEELRRPLEWLRRQGWPSVEWIAYPYGAVDARVARAAEAAGYRGGFAVEGGWADPRARDRLSLPRVNIPPGMTRHGFALRVAGLLS